MDIRHILKDNIHESGGCDRQGIFCDPGSFLINDPGDFLNDLIKPGQFLRLLGPVHKPAKSTDISGNRWIYYLHQGFFCRTTADNKRYLNAPPECRHLLLDAGLKVAKEVNCQIMLIDDIPLFIR